MTPTRNRNSEVYPLDHLINLYGGTTMALEMQTRSLQSSKDQQLSRVDLWRKVGAQQSENEFFRTCYRLWTDCLRQTHDCCDDLDLLYYFEPDGTPVDNETMHQAVVRLRRAMEKFRAKEMSARKLYLRFWSIPESEVDRSFGWI